MVFFKANHFIALLSGIALICSSAFSLAQAEKVEKNAEPLALKQLQAFSEAYYQIKTNYVREVDDAALLEAAIAGMVASLDPHSRYLPKQEFENFNKDTEGEYTGIGLTFIEHKFGIEIASVITDSPAARAGLKPDMLVTHINQKSLRFMPVDEVYRILQGEAGTSVSLTVTSSEFSRPQDFQLTREVLLLQSISSEWLPGGVGYIAIKQFTLKSFDEFLSAIKQFPAGQSMRRLIIDLRNNPGGVMEVALALSDLFIAEGRLIIASSRSEASRKIYYANEEAPLQHAQVVVVINAASASASEIFALALKEHGKAVILGEKSYGKGSIQTVIPISQEAGVQLTSAEYLSPSGAKIQGEGVMPDVVFKQQINAKPRSVKLLDDPELLQAYNLLF